MFSLIIFSLVMIATISQNLTAAFLNDDALGGWNIQAYANSGQPVSDFNTKATQAVQNPSDVLDIGKITQPSGLALATSGPPLRCQYHATVMNTFERVSRISVGIRTSWRG